MGFNFLSHGCNGRFVIGDGVWIYQAFSGFWYKKKYSLEIGAILFEGSLLGTCVLLREN